MSERWWSVEVLDGRFSAERWRDAHGSALVEAALTNGARDWSWMIRPWGVILEVEFADDGAWEVYRHLPAVVAALDAVPDPVNGLLVYPGRGGSSGSAHPRRPAPRAGSGAAALPEIVEPVVVSPDPTSREGLGLPVR